MVREYKKEEIKKIRQSGKILAEVLKILKQEIKAGVSLSYLDNLAYKLTKERGADPAFFGYKPHGAEKKYPFSICASLNNVVVHGQPSDYKIKDSDVLKIDFGVKYKDFYSDAAFTIIVGNKFGFFKKTKEAEKLVKATKTALDQAIKAARSGNHLGDIGWAIERTAKKFKVNVIKGLVGHGIGKNLHEEPTVYNFGEKGKGIELKPGMVLAIEPMFSLGSGDIKQLKDESWATKDNFLSAQFEHTIAITTKKAEILTI